MRTFSYLVPFCVIACTADGIFPEDDAAPADGMVDGRHDAPADSKTVDSPGVDATSEAGDEDDASMALDATSVDAPPDVSNKKDAFVDAPLLDGSVCPPCMN